MLYLKGISTGEFSEALAALLALGKDARGLSPTAIIRLKDGWIDAILLGRVKTWHRLGERTSFAPNQAIDIADGNPLGRPTPQHIEGGRARGSSTRAGQWQRVHAVDPAWSKNSSDRLFMRPLDDNDARARPIARGIGRAAHDRGPGSEEIAGRCPFLGGCAPHGSGQPIRSVPAVANARQRG
jgi:hypothetical protein